MRVRFRQRLGDFDRVAKHLVERQAAARQPRRQRLAFEKLHHQEVDAVLMADVVQVADVRVIQRGDRARLALEALSGARIGDAMRRDDLDGDRAIQPGVAGAVDLAHPAGVEGRADFVWPEPVSSCQRHFGSTIRGFRAAPG